MSWSGSMFEYLMPELVMATPAEQPARRRPTGRGREPDPHGRARRARGATRSRLQRPRSEPHVPVLATSGERPRAEARARRGPGRRPYATALAAMVDPVAAAREPRRAGAIGASGPYGFYEAVDFTGARLPDGVRYAVVKAYIAHHQGMSVVALCNVLDGFPMRRRFHAAPIVRATELLLHERAPRDVVVVSSCVHPGQPPFNLHVAPSSSAAPEPVRSPTGRSRHPPALQRALLGRRSPRPAPGQSLERARRHPVA
jgi:cyclic beta-1,2-glucan synthetase